MMDVQQTPMPQQVKDELGEKVQKLFQDFLEEYPRESDEKKYLPQARELVRPDRNTLIVDFADIEKHDTRLKNAIHEQIYRLHPFLCNAVKNFVKDNVNAAVSSLPEAERSQQSQQQIPANKEFYIAFENVSHTSK